MTILAHGVDLVEIPRIQRMLQEHGDRFVERCFCPGERHYADAGGSRRAERYSARFACKEAVLKALGTGWRSGISWCDIEVIREASGRPGLFLSGRCLQIAVEMRIRHWHVSLSHTSNLAVASVIGVGDQD
jgi:holo-[acyl-carrier protein] synthase